MPTTKITSRRGSNEFEKNRKGRLSEKSVSFHVNSPVSPSKELRRPKTCPELISYRNTVAGVSSPAFPRPRLTKLLLNVTIQGSVGAVQVVISPESTVGELISAAVILYVKECRRPFLPSSDASRYDLHYSQFSLESLEREEKLIGLGSRNFFLCLRKEDNGGGGATASCSTEAEKVTNSGFRWLSFMNFLK